MMKKILIVLLFPFLVFSQNTIKMDGFFDDWTGEINTYIDDSSDSEGVDFLDFSVCHDDEYLYIRIKLDAEIEFSEIEKDAKTKSRVTKRKKSSIKKAKKNYRDFSFDGESDANEEAIEKLFEEGTTLGDGSNDLF